VGMQGDDGRGGRTCSRRTRRVRSVLRNRTSMSFHATRINPVCRFTSTSKCNRPFSHGKSKSRTAWSSRIHQRNVPKPSSARCNSRRSNTLSHWGSASSIACPPLASAPPICLNARYQSSAILNTACVPLHTGLLVPTAGAVFHSTCWNRASSKCTASYCSSSNSSMGLACLLPKYPTNSVLCRQRYRTRPSIASRNPRQTNRQSST
jgi:hypothetical protein